MKRDDEHENFTRQNHRPMDIGYGNVVSASAHAGIDVVYARNVVMRGERDMYECLSCVITVILFSLDVSASFHVVYQMASAKFAPIEIKIITNEYSGAR